MKMPSKITIISLGLILLLPAAANAADGTPQEIFEQANQLFKNEQYQEALDKYALVLAQGGESGALYYNIGNSYYKLGRLGKAIVNYERAKKFLPRDSDLAANLAFANSLRAEPITPKKTFWLIRIFEKGSEKFTLDELSAMLALLFCALMLIFSLNFKNRLVGGAVLCLLLFSAGLWLNKFYVQEAGESAVVIFDDVDSKFAPSENAIAYFKLSEGEKINIIARSGEWRRVKTPDNKIGWVTEKALEKI